MICTNLHIQLALIYFPSFNEQYYPYKVVLFVLQLNSKRHFGSEKRFVDNIRRCLRFTIKFVIGFRPIDKTHSQIENVIVTYSVVYL